MNEYDEIQVSEWLRDGIAAAKAGRRDEAQKLLMQVVEVNERSEQAWLWLSSVVDTDEDRLICLENVLAVNPDNVQARAGLKWLQEQGVGVEEREAGAAEWEEQRADIEVLQSPIPAPPGDTSGPSSPQPSASREPDLFMTPEGCVYCGLVVDEKDTRCPHCGGQLVTKQFKHEERSPLGYLLHAYWLLLVGINMADFFIIGFVWGNVDNISPFIKRYLPYFTGPVIIGNTTLNTFVEFDLFVQMVRWGLVGLSFLGGLVALGLFLRRPRAHSLGLALIALHLLIGLALFALGFLGYVMLAFRGLLTVMLILFMFNTVEDFFKEERREWLEADRHLLNDVDYYARGRLYEKRGMWAKALLHWQRAAAMDPRRDTYLGAMARAYAHLGRYEVALKQIDEALRVSRRPEEWEALRETIVQLQRGAAVEEVGE